MAQNNKYVEIYQLIINPFYFIIKIIKIFHDFIILLIINFILFYYYKIHNMRYN